MSKKKYLFFSPHQDDELLTMGVIINKLVKANNDVHVILCTDGSSSIVREKLNDGNTCSKHEGIHQYNIGVEEFVQLRDEEFFNSCLALGIDRNNIHYYKDRIKDCSLNVDVCKKIINEYLYEYGNDCIVCTISPNNGDKQHNDHIALGKAAEELFNEKLINELYFFIEPYLYDLIKDNARKIPVQPYVVKTDNKDDLNNAIKQYSIWDPDNKRYAIGYHSAGIPFMMFKKSLTNYYFIKKQENLMSVREKIVSRYKKWEKLHNQVYLFYSGKRIDNVDLGDLKVYRFNIDNIDKYKQFCKKYHKEIKKQDHKRIIDGSSFYGLINGDVMVSCGWLAYKQPFYISEVDYYFDMSKSNDAILYDFKTKKDYRGKGYYGILLNYIRCDRKDIDSFIIYTSPDNNSSYKGIIKAGFIHDGNLSDKDNNLKPYLMKHNFTDIKKKYKLYGQIIDKRL